MRRFLLVTLACLIAAFALAAPGPEWAGNYEGDWSSTVTSTKGDFRMKLRAAGEGKWEFEVVFTLGGRDVITTTKSLKIEGSKIEASYEFDLADNRLMSTITGELAGGKVEGRYQTVAVPGGTGVDEGVWKAAAKK